MRTPEWMAGPVGAFVRSDLRRRWPTFVVIGVLFGLVAGIGLGCLAGARRTATLFERHLAASSASHVEIDPGTPTPEVDRAIRALPGVVEASYWTSVSAYPLGPDGLLDESYGGGLVFTTDGRYLGMDRVAVAEGRRLDPARPDEIMVNEVAVAVYGYTVGSRLDLGWFPADENGIPVVEQPTNPFPVTVVGIMALNDDVTAEELDAIPRLFVSPAAEVPAPPPEGEYVGFSWYGLRLSDGQADVEAVVQEWDRVARAHNEALTAEQAADPNQTWINVVRRTSDLETKASRGVRPLVVALGAFGLLVALAALLLAVQAMVRATREGAATVRIGQVLGMRTGQVVGVALVGPAASVVTAVLCGLATALVVSSRFPIGPHRVLEPDRGTGLDPWVLGTGFAAMLAITMLAVAFTAWRSAHQSPLGREGAARRPSAIVQAACRSGSPAPLVAALYFTVDPGRGKRAQPTRSVVASLVTIVTLVVSILVFGGSLRALTDDPARFGWQAEAIVNVDGGYGTFEPEGVAAWAAEHEDVQRWQLVGADRTAVDGLITPGVLYSEVHGGGSALTPVLTAGRAPRGAGEVVLGADTQQVAGAAIGSPVMLGSGDAARTVIVTGTAVFPVHGPVLALRTGLGTGVWLDPADVGVFEFVGSFGSMWNGVLLDLRPGADLEALRASIDSPPLVTDGTDGDLFGVIRPAEVRSASDAARYEIPVLIVLTITALLTMVLVLGTMLRRRTRDLAVYRALGFTRGQMRATMGVQALIHAGLALVLGMPLGLLLGRTLWRSFATDLGVVADLAVVSRALVSTAIGVLVIGTLAAAGPAWAIGRRSASARIDAE